jgi:hypothetical protein
VVAFLRSVTTAVWVVSPVRAPGGAGATVAEQRSTMPSPGVAGVERTATPPGAAPGVDPPAGAPVAMARTSRALAVRGAQASEADALQDRHPVPALAEIEPLLVASVEPDPLQIAGMEVAPLKAMPSIDIPSLGPGSNDIQPDDSKKEK